MKRLLAAVSAVALVVFTSARAQQNVIFPNRVPVTNSNLTNALAAKANGQNGALVNPTIRGGASTSNVVATGATAARSLPDHFGGALDVKDFGAACDGATDDSAAFQAAMNAGSAAGKLVVFSSTCVVHTQISETVDPAGGLFALHGLAGGVILTNNNNLFRYIAPAAHAGYHPAKLDFQDFAITNQGVHNHGVVVYVDCSRYLTNCTRPVSTIQNVHVTDLATLFDGIAVGGINIDRNEFDRTTGVTAVSFAIFQGPMVGRNQLFSANDFVHDNFVIGGNFILTVGGIQDLIIKDNTHLEGISGVYETRPVLIEQINVIGNYLEENLAGIYLPNCAYCQVEQNSFDSSGLGIANTYRAILVGSPGLPGNGLIVDHNVVFGIPLGITKNPLIYVNALDGGVVDHNVVDGTIATPDCILAGSDTPIVANQVVNVSDNSCWAAGVISLIGKAVVTRGNSYSINGVNTKVPDRN